jgi:hypothetical protein
MPKPETRTGRSHGKLVTGGGSALRLSLEVNYPGGFVELGGNKILDFWFSGWRGHSDWLLVVGGKCHVNRTVIKKGHFIIAYLRYIRLCRPLHDAEDIKKPRMTDIRSRERGSRGE